MDDDFVSALGQDFAPDITKQLLIKIFYNMPDQSKLWTHSLIQVNGEPSPKPFDW